MSCHTPAIKPAAKPLKAEDTTKAISHPDTHLENDAAVVLKTHLGDTTYATGSFILFLRPDDARYAELEKEAEGEAGDGDADFGAGISGTRDSLKRNEMVLSFQLRGVRSLQHTTACIVAITSEK